MWYTKMSKNKNYHWNTKDIQYVILKLIIRCLYESVFSKLNIVNSKVKCTFEAWSFRDIYFTLNRIENDFEY